MLGAVAGDTIGSVYEFHNTKHYDFELLRPDSIYTDDSIISFAVLEWILNDFNHSYQTLEKAMVDIAKEYRHPMGGYGGGFRTWLFYPDQLYEYDPSKLGEPPYISDTGRHPYGSWGNGAAMRVGAVGWFFDTLDETERVAAISSAITHNHLEGIKGAQAVAAGVFLARSGNTKEEIRDYIENKFGYDLHKSWEEWYSVYRWDSSCQGTVPQALISFLDSDNFVDAIRKAVSLGGDSDTMACITGGVAEAFYGGVPHPLAEEVFHRLPVMFQSLLKNLWEKSSYGTVCPNYSALFREE